MPDAEIIKVEIKGTGTFTPPAEEKPKPDK